MGVDFRKKEFEVDGATYKLIGNCRDCKVGVYDCVTDKTGVDTSVLGDRQACYFMDNSCVCRKCYDDRL